MKTSINSGYSDNYRRINAINSLIEAEYELTQNKEIRKKIRNKQDVEADDINDVYYLHEESLLIGASFKSQKESNC